MAGTSSQYLEVPRVQPGRRLRSRPRSRPRQPEAVLPSVKIRPQTPPMPAVAEPVRKPSLDGFSTPPPRKETANGYMSVQQPTTLVTTPVIQMQNFSMDDEPATANYDDLNGTMYTLEPCLSPPPAIPLRQRLIGTWKLESYVAYPGPTSIIRKQTYPMTKNVTGSIMYTPDGYMSAQMLIPGQQTFKRGEGEDPQWTEAAKRFFAYSGPYYITNEGPGREEILRHTFQVCNLPGWIGDIQIRTHRFEEDGQVLVLGSETPTEIKGDKRIPVLKWRRARDNSHGDPPPPTPQIKISGPGEP